MFDERNKTIEDDNVSTFTFNECEEKIKILNKKLQDTANELEEISSLYAKSVKEGLEKNKKIKELEDIIEELMAELKKCQNKNKQLEEELKKCNEDKTELKACQEDRKKLEEELIECKKNKIIESCADNEKIDVIVPISQIKRGIYSVTGDDETNVYCVGKSNKVFKVKKNKEVEIIGEVDANCRAIKYDGLENIFIGSNNGTIYKYNIKTEDFIEVEQYENQIITAIETDNNHNVYIGMWSRTASQDETGSGRIYKMAVGTISLFRMRGTIGSVWSLKVDNNNNIYAGTTKGLFISNDQYNFISCQQHVPYENTPVQTVRAIIIDKNQNIWIGTRERQYLGHIYRCKKEEKEFTRISEKTNGEVFSLAIDSQENIYAGTWNTEGVGYLFKYCNNSNSFNKLESITNNIGSIEDIFINKNDEIFIGTRLGNDNDGRLYKMKRICI